MKYIPILFSILFSVASIAQDGQLSGVDEFEFEDVQVIHRESNEVPTVTVLLYFKGGTSILPDNNAVANEYFSFNLIPGSGSKLTSKQYYRRKILRMGSGIGGDDGRDYSVLSMRSTREHFDTTWKYFTERLTHPTVDQTEFDNFRRNALVGIESGRQNPDQVGRIFLDSVYFQGHPYSRRLTRDAILSVTPESVMEHYKKLLDRGRMLLVVVGNISRDELDEKLEQSGIAKLPKSDFEMPELPVPERSKSPAGFIPKFERKLPTRYVKGFFRIPSKGSPDYYPYLRLRNFMGGFLFQHLRVQTNLSYAPDITEYDGRESVGVISFETDHVDSAMRLIFRDIDFFTNNPISQGAIKGNVAKWTTTTNLKQETTPEVAQALGQAQILTGSWKNAFVSYNKLSNVKPEDIIRVARTYFRNINWAVVGDPNGVDVALLMSR
jgi:zinc protease